MTSLSDSAVSQLRRVLERPELPGGRYTILEEIGRGGMGIVYRAHDGVLDRDVALKVLHLRRSSPGVIPDLQDEARTLAALEHPGIVPVHDAGILPDGQPFYVMRLVRGERLDSFAARNPGRGEIMRVLLRVCETIAFAHRHGVIHRDLKPGNIMIGPFGDVLVLDWGVAGRIDAAAGMSSGSPSSAAAVVDPRTSVSVGTPGFMPPEQRAAGANRIDERADVFALGVIVRELLSLDGGVLPRPLQSIVSKATAATPEDRYRNSQELAEELRRWIDGESVSAHRETFPETAYRLYLKHQVAVLLLLTYAVVRVAILIWRGV